MMLHSGPWSVNAAGSTATLTSGSTAAAGSGAGGLLLTASTAQPVVIAGPAISVAAGKPCNTSLFPLPANSAY